MGVTYSSPDSPFTQLCAVFTCRCGATASEVGRRAGSAPPGWERVSESLCICEHCRERSERGRREGRRIRLTPGPS